MRKPVFTCIIAATALIFSCKKDDKHATWETGIVAPLLKSTLSVKDILTDTLITVDSDSSLKIVYQNHLYNFSIDSLIQLPDTSIIRSYKIESLSLVDLNFTYPITLADICNNLGIIGALILAQHGNSAAIPAISGLSSGAFTINADTLFQTITLVTGKLDISIYNGFPIEITNLQFELRDSITNAILVQDTFASIMPGTTAMGTYSLDGKTVNAYLHAEITNMDSPGSNGQSVPIDTTDAIVASLKVHDLHPFSATAIWPAQDIVNKFDKLKIKGFKVQLTSAKARAGSVSADLFSTLEDSVKFSYILPSATLNGDTFDIIKTLDPAPPGGVIQHHEIKDFTNYHLDLTGQNHDTVNTMYYQVIARMDSSGVMRSISLTDSFYAEISFYDIVPEFAKGYFGQDTFDVGPASVPVDVFNNIRADDFQVEKVKMNLTISNGIGIDGLININSLTSSNTNTNTTVTLSGPGLATPFSVLRASDANYPPVTYTTNVFLLDQTNSNANAFVANLPQQIGYSLQLITNPNGSFCPQHPYCDFIYYGDGLTCNMDFEMPLSMIAGNLTLTDTLDFTMSDVDLANIQSGTMTLIADNGFPFDAYLQVYLLSDSYIILDSLFTVNLVAAAPVNVAGYVTTKKQSKLIIPVDKPLINDLFKTTRMAVKARFYTKPASQFIKVYSDYTIDLKLTGDFIYINN